MISIVKYFRRNHFSEKIIFLKIFFGIWLAQKNYDRRKSKSGYCCWNPATFGRCCLIPGSRFGCIPAIIWSAGSGDDDRMSLDSGAGSFFVAGCCRIPRAA
jgi:hypothetical protein